jgi:pentatricopeptide repeat protein
MNQKNIEVKEISLNWKELSPQTRKRELDNVVDQAIRTGGNGLGLGRTRTDIYQVGIPRPRLSARAYSNVSPISDITEPRPTARLVSPNRVQMDLAGLDIPRHRSFSTTAPTSNSAATDESIDYPPTSKDETDRRIYSAIYHATKDSRRDFCNSLIAHYRSPRDAPSPHPEIEEHLPRPTGYSVGTYNACLAALLAVRRVGESIAPLLEIYNEMLEREILPNGRTYVSVIQALCLREKDVQAAVEQAGETQKWASFRHSTLGLKSPQPTKEERDVISGYLAEKNFDSAYNLFKGILSVQEQSTPGGFYRFHPSTYSYLLDALATRINPSPRTWDQAMEVFEHAIKTETAGARLLYKHLFRLLAKLDNENALTALWERFVKEGEEGGGRRMRDWKDILPGQQIDEREIQVEGFQREVWSSAIPAFIIHSQVDKGMDLLDQMLAHESGVDLSKPPRVKEDTFGLAILALAERDEFTKAQELFEKSKGYGGIRPVDMGKYLDILAIKGQWKLALDTYLPYLKEAKEGYNPDQRRIRRIYASILRSAKSSIDDLRYIEGLMATGTYMLDTDLATAHINLLLKNGQYDAIAPVLNSFGPMMVRMEQETRNNMYPLLETIITSDIPFQTTLSVLSAFARQKIYPPPSLQGVVGGIISKYVNARPVTIDQEGWNTLLYVFSRTAAPELDHGEYDEAFEFFIADLQSHAPETLKMDNEGRLVKRLAGHLFDRFGSEKTTLLLTPLLGEAETQSILEPFYEQSVPELVYDSSSTASSNPSSPLQPEQVQRKLIIDETLSRRIDSHSSRPDGRNQISPQRAYTELRTSLSSNRIPHPESLSRLLITFARSNDEARVLELYGLAQSLIAQTTNPKSQAAWWRVLEDAMLISNCHLGHLEQAGLHRHRLVERGMAPSADAYATMIASSKDTTDDAQVARELWDESVQMGVRPHLYLYNTVISKLSKARKAENALEMFGQMKERGVRPSSVTYGAVIVSQAVPS